MTAPTSRPIDRVRWTAADAATTGLRVLPEETPIALVHDGSTTAVMMGSPSDLEDFGIGFSLSEGIIRTAAEIRDLEVATSDLGIEVRMWLESDRTQALAARRRRLAGPTGCGLCGLESLEDVARAIPTIGQDLEVTPSDLLSVMADLEAAQVIGKVTRAVHGAGLWRPGKPLVFREDVGRHNALDKLIGAVSQTDPSRAGVLALTSRVSIEMIQKACALGAPILCAMSAPTSLAVRLAHDAGLTLVAIARSDGFEVFTHPRRIEMPAID